LIVVAVAVVSGLGAAVGLSGAPAFADRGPTYHNSWYPNGTTSYWPTPDWTPTQTGHPTICANVIGSGTFYISPRYTNNDDVIGHSSPDYNADNAYHCFTIPVTVNAGRSFYARIVPHNSMNEAWAYATY